MSALVCRALAHTGRCAHPSLQMGKLRPRGGLPEGLRGGHGIESQALTLTMLFVLSHFEESLKEPQVAEENSRNPRSAWEPGHFSLPPLAAPRPLCDLVGVASFSVPLLQQSDGKSVDSTASVSPSTRPHLCVPLC